MDLESFVIQWGLDESAQTVLAQLEPDVQARLVRDFSPRPGTRDVNRLFHGFVRSLQSGGPPQRPVSGEIGPPASSAARSAAQGGEAADAANGGLPSASVDVAAFIAQWGLDTSCEASLLEQPPEVQARVVLEFQPKPGTRDVIRLFHGFLKSVRFGGGGPASQHHGAAYSSAWALNNGLAIPPAQAAAYAAAVAASGGGEDGWRPSRSSWYQQQHHHHQPRIVPVPLRPQQQQTPRTPGESVQAFAARWGLDESAQAALQSLDPALREQVMADFAPKPGTRDVTRLFHGFLRSVQTAPRVQGEAAPTADAAFAAQLGVPTSGRAGREASPPAATYEVSPPATHEAELDLEQMQAFVLQWALDETSQELMLALEPQVQALVVREFSPKPNTQDVNRLFQSFVRSVGSRAASGGAPLAHSRQVPAPSIAAAITQSFASQGGFTPARAASPTKRPGGIDWASQGQEGPNADDIAMFLQHWGLDNASAVALEGLSPEVQWRVLDQFQPRPGTRDVRSLFYGFIKSVSMGAGGKRPRFDVPLPYNEEELISA